MHVLLLLLSFVLKEQLCQTEIDFFFSKKPFFPSDHFSLLLHPAAPVPLLYIQ